jgi:spore coat protein U-like protein
MGMRAPYLTGYRLLSIVGGFVALTAHGAASADTLSSSLDARIRVDTSCRLTTEPLQFGTVNILSGQVDATANIRLRCGPAVAYSVAIDNGQNFNGQRRMQGGAGFFSYVPYQIYRNAARNQVWGATAGTMATGVTPANGLVTLVAYGRVPNSIVLPREYIDTVTVTVNF